MKTSKKAKLIKSEKLTNMDKYRMTTCQILQNIMSNFKMFKTDVGTF